MTTTRLIREIIYGLPVFKEELRCDRRMEKKIKEQLRDERTHILATCMAAFPYTPTNQLAKEFEISASSINRVAAMYGVHKNKATRSKINRENGHKNNLNRRMIYE